MQTATKFLGRLLVGAAGRPALLRYGLALLFPVFAFLITAPITRASLILFFPIFTAAVVVASAIGGTTPGLVAVAESVAINVLAASPHGSLRAISPEDGIRIAVFALAGGLIALLIGSLGDLQQHLDEERSQLSITLRSIGDAVIATDAGGRVTLMNPVAEDATGWKFASAAGLPLESVFKIINESSREPVESPVRKVLERGRVAGLANHTVLLRPDGTEIPIEDSAAPIRDPRGSVVGVVLVFRDVTQQKLREKALLRAEKLATAGRLAATIAHEMNNPLEAVCNLLYLLGQDGTLSADAKASVDLAQSLLARAAEMSRRTLSFNRAGSVLKDARLRELVESVVGLYASVANARGVRIENRVPPGLEIRAMNEIRQAISNLVSNALDAMPEGGTLDIDAESVEGPDRPHVQMTFSDTGHGIDPAYLDLIFEPFFTTKKDSGTGLGLWSAQRIVEEHGGRLQVESSNAGTRFTVLLPLESATNLAVRSDSPSCGGTLSRQG